MTVLQVYKDTWVVIGYDSMFSIEEGLEANVFESEDAANDECKRMNDVTNDDIKFYVKRAPMFIGGIKVFEAEE